MIGIELLNIIICTFHTNSLLIQRRIQFYNIRYLQFTLNLQHVDYLVLIIFVFFLLCKP